MVIVLHYPDKSAAADVNEIQRRPAEYEIEYLQEDHQPFSRYFAIGQPEAVKKFIASPIKTRGVSDRHTVSRVAAPDVHSG
jgi:hypothetical protein